MTPVHYPKKPNIWAILGVTKTTVTTTEWLYNLGSSDRSGTALNNTKVLENLKWNGLFH